MKVLVTGAQGFIGKNLVAELRTRGINALEFDLGSPPDALDSYCREAEFVFHLAGINRPLEPAEFMHGNFGFTQVLLDTLRQHHNTCPVMLASSTQAALANPYGMSKRAGEQLMFDYSITTSAPVIVYRFPNVFGKWSRPNYNSAIATFCHNIARGLPITVNDPSTVLNLVYIDDVVAELLRAMQGHPHKAGDFCAVPITHTATLGYIVALLQSFAASRGDLSLPNFAEPLAKKLYSTYLSFLPPEGFSYPLKMNIDQRGSFTEFLKTREHGQVSVNITKPHITKGNHWHHTKCEKFLVVSGSGVIRFRHIGAADVIEYHVSGDKLEVLDIPPGYTHNISNVGTTDLVTIMWASEAFDPANPDTYAQEV